MGILTPPIRLDDHPYHWKSNGSLDSSTYEMSQLNIIMNKIVLRSFTGLSFHKEYHNPYSGCWTLILDVH